MILRAAALNRFLHWFVVGLMSPVFVLMILSRGVSMDRAGLVLAIMSGTIVALELPSGILSDRVGRKGVYLASLGVAAVSLALLYAARGLGAVSAALALYGASRALSSGSIEAAFVDEYLLHAGEGKLSALMGAMNAAEAVGLALGALVGGWLPGLWSRLGRDGNPYALNILAQVVVIAMLAILTFPIRFGNEAHPDRASRASLGQAAADKPVGFARQALAIARADSALTLLLAGAAAWGLAFGSVELFWQPRFKGILGGGNGAERILGAVNAAYFLAAAAGGVVMGRLLAAPLGRSARRLKPMAAAAVSRLVTGAFIMALAAQNGAAGFAVIFVAIMLSNGMGGVAESTAFNARVPGARRASFMSLSSLVMQLGGIVSSLVFGALSSWVPVAWLWTAAGTVFAVSGLAYIRASEPKTS